MSVDTSKSNNSRHSYRLFPHAKPWPIDSTYSSPCLIQFPRLPITLPPFVPTFISSRWTDDAGCESLSRKPSYNSYRHPHHIRRRIPKRYSDIVVPSSSKSFSSRKDSTTREKHNYYNHSSAHILRRHSLKPLHETIYYFHSSKKKSREIKDHHFHHHSNHPIIKHNDLLAHRMQAAMSSELMHSLDRNFVVGDQKQLFNHVLMPRSHSFNICALGNRKSQRNSSRHLIPRVNINFEQENIHIEEPAPDYEEQNEEIIIRTIGNDNDISEEPIADYDDPKPNMKGESDDKTIPHSELRVSSSYIVPQTSTPPVPPPLPNLNTEQKKPTFRCRTIADKISSDHKLILKDKEEEINPSNISSEPEYFHISKAFKLRKTSQTLSRSRSVYGSIFQQNNHETKSPKISPKPLSTNDPVQDRFSSPSPTTSLVIGQEYEPRSSSSKIYQDYKERTSRTSIPTTLTRNQSMIIHPMHTKIELRSSANEKLSDMTLASKQMNVCVINQLNEHLSTRFRKQQQEQESCSNNKKKNTDQQSYEPLPEMMTGNKHLQSNVYDEPNDLPVTNQICSSIPPPPPPPPLPVGGFRPVIPSINRSSTSQRTSITTSTGEANNSELALCSIGTSTISSNLSDTRILCELRENPLFTRAKQHIEIEPGSTSRRSEHRINGSTTNLPHTDHPPTSYLRLDTCSKTNLKKSMEPTSPKQLETIIMLPNELNAIIGKRTKSTNDISQSKSRPCPKPPIKTPRRQSELELIFQKRAQRSEQNLT